MSENSNKQSWVTPKLESLDIKETLSGVYQYPEESVFVPTNLPFTGPSGTIPLP